MTTRLGPHVQYFNAEVAGFLQKTRPRLVKWMDWSESGIYGLRWCREAFHPVVIGRVYEENDLIRRILELSKLGLVDYWELWNEPAAKNREDLARLNDLTLGAMRLLPETKVLVGSFSEGNPADMNSWPAFYPCMREAMARGGGIALHEYDAPTMNQSQGWRCGRFRISWDLWPDDLKAIPIFVTECGIDFGVDHANIGLPQIKQQGWKSRVGEEAYVSDLRWYDGVLHQEGPRVRGATIFTCGWHEPWSSFDIAGSRLIGDYLAAERGDDEMPEETRIGSTRTPPEGVSWWIWYLDAARRGRSYEEFARACLQLGIKSVFVKAGDGDNVWEQFARCVGPLKAAGLRVYSWSYVYGGNGGGIPSTPAGEANVALAALRAGADGHIFDIEGEAEASITHVREIWRLTRAQAPNVWLAYAPLPVVDLHNPPMYALCNEYADAVMPQFYWGALGRGEYATPKLFDEWNSWLGDWQIKGERVPEFMPVGQAYGDATSEEIVEFAQLASQHGCGNISFWEWVGSSDIQFEVVREVASWYEPVRRPSIFDHLDLLYGSANDLDALVADLLVERERIDDLVNRVSRIGQTVRERTLAIKASL